MSSIIYVHNTDDKLNKQYLLVVLEINHLSDDTKNNPTLNPTLNIMIAAVAAVAAVAAGEVQLLVY